MKPLAPHSRLCGNAGGEEDEGDDDTNMMEEEVDKSLHIKGQMNFMPDWNVVMFLCSPAISNLEQLQVVGITITMIIIGMVIINLEQLQAAGLFICDLSMHDFSRDLLLASRFGSLFFIQKFFIRSVLFVASSPTS